MTDSAKPESPTEPSALADAIVEWLITRNGGELGPAFGNMRVSDYRLLREELEHILRCGKYPDNWHKDPAP
jgi:hypothetical protein